MANINLFYISEKCIREYKNPTTGAAYVSVRFLCDQSASGFATIIVEPEQVVPCVIRGEVIEGRRTVYLGNGKDSRSVRICLSEPTEISSAVYKNIFLTNAEIKAIHHRCSVARSKQMLAVNATNKIAEAINAEIASNKPNASAEMTVKTNITINSDNKMVIETVIDRC